jgi:glycosyltransferase involved in cell wall biosynthesis
MTKVLLFIDWYVPAYKSGGPLRSVENLTLHLQNEFEFLIVTRNSDYKEDRPFEDIISDCWTSLRSNVKVYYFSKKQLRLNNLKALIQTEIFDIAYVNGIYSFYFSILPILLMKRYTKKKIIISPRGMLSKGSVNVKKLRKKMFLRIAKLSGFYKNIIFHATSETEKNDILREISKKNVIDIIPNLSVDNEFTAETQIKKEKGELHLFTISRIAPEKNILFALDILLKCDKGMIKFDIYGPVYNEKYWQVCKDRIAQLPKNIEVNYMNSVKSSEIPGIIKNYHFLLFPTTGENYGHTIIESLLNACPVIISDQTPWHHLDDSNAGFEISLSDPLKWTNTIMKLVQMDHSDYLQMRQSAKNYAKSMLDTDNTVNNYRELFMYN